MLRLFCMLGVVLGYHAEAQQYTKRQPRQVASGPLKVHPQNPRYFADASGKAVFLTGSHSWDNLRDWKPRIFDFDQYLKFLVENNHNFIRLWAWDLPQFDATGQWELKANEVAPFPWRRTGAGLAQDGRPKFDLSQFNSYYFDRLRQRVKASGDQGIYVSIMLFEGWNMHRLKDVSSRGTHPFVGTNNVNNVDVSGNRIYSLEDTAALHFQEAYVRQVIDTIHDLDNVLYEIINEAHPGSSDWQYHMIDLIHNYEKSKLRQHPVGMTHYGGKILNDSLFASPADWISPGAGPYYKDPPAADGRKVMIADSDHIRPLRANHSWVWKSYCRGLNVILMDSFTIESYGSFEKATDAGNQRCRAAMGHVKSFSDRMELSNTTPQGKLSSTNYCLANPGFEYLVYQPGNGEFTVDLEAGAYHVEWFNPVKGTMRKSELVSNKDVRQRFSAPFQGEAVLYLVRHDLVK